MNNDQKEEEEEEKQQKRQAIPLVLSTDYGLNIMSVDK
jgi:hypothetical protein